MIVSKWNMDYKKSCWGNITGWASGIFVAPDHFCKGYGTIMMQEVENMFPEVKEIMLDTPVWNVRTNSFYSKLGYKEIKRDKELVFYSKHS